MAKETKTMSLFNPPTVCRMVHYKDTADGQCLAAMITKVYVDTGSVCLAVFQPMAHVFNVDSVDFGEPTDAGTWHWPERV